MHPVRSASGAARVPQAGPTGLTRRAALALPLLAVAACAAPSGSTGASTGSALPSSADEAMLIAQYDAAIAAFPALGTTLRPIRDQHAGHLAALGSPAGTAGAPAPAPASSQAALAGLSAAEKAAAAMRLSDCLSTSEPALVRILALIAASEASHVAELVGA